MSEQKVKQAFKAFIKEQKKKKDYVKGSYAEDTLKRENVLLLLAARWGIEVEYNNESAHEYDEQDEFLSIQIIEVIE